MKRFTFRLKRDTESRKAGDVIAAVEAADLAEFAALWRGGALECESPAEPKPERPKPPRAKAAPER